MNTHHTSGPWIEKELPHGAIYIEAHPDLNNGHNIAKCFGPDRKANARLIAAAPELLETAAQLLAEYDRKFGKLVAGTTAFADAYLALHNAIAKATQP